MVVRAVAKVVARAAVAREVVETVEEMVVAKVTTEDSVDFVENDAGEDFVVV